MTPTPEQLAAVSFVSSWPTHNLYLEARAGCAKTSTLELLIAALPASSVLVLAFNKGIQLEMESRFPPDRSPTAPCFARTFNSIGSQCVKDYLGKWPKLDDKKMFFALRAELAKLSDADREELQPKFADILRLARLTKHLGWLPDEIAKFGKSLISDSDLFDSFEETISPLIRRLITTICVSSFRAIFTGQIDYDDQVLFPAVMSVTVPKYSVIMVDEAQDLSPVNHEFVCKLAKHGSHIIAVGDSYQAIYGFRGAHSSSIETLRSRLPGETLILSTCFRCPQSVIREAWSRAPEMQWPDSAPEGLVSRPDSWTLSSVPNDSTILCRKNAPLYALAFKFLRSGRPVQLRGRDVAASLAPILKKLGKENTTTEAALLKLAEYSKNERKNHKDREAFFDKIACCEIILEQGTTIGEALRAVDRLLESPGRITLMTGHKSKGLQFSDVFILNSADTKDIGQNLNILYVMQTRSQNTLTYIEMDELV